MQIVIDISEARFRDIQRIADVQLEMCHFQTAEQIIAKGVPIEQELKWIPVNERLPEEEIDVLVCNSNGEIEISAGTYSTEANDFMWYTSGWRFGKVIAWMPLPKPYESQESEDRECGK